MSDTTQELLDERAKIYGDPVLCHSRIAEVWSGILNREVTAHEVALCMTGLKLVRAQNSPDYPDSLDDAAGYVSIAQKVMGHDVAPEPAEAQVHRCSKCGLRSKDPLLLKLHEESCYGPHPR